MQSWKILLIVLALGPSALACDLKYDPAAAPHYYREKGWKLPGIKDFIPYTAGQPHEFPLIGSVPGAKTSIIEHEFPYVITFPAQEFVVNGTRQRMRQMQVKATIVRWEIGDRVVAYSYGLTPVSAHKKHGKWVITSEVGCIFTVTFVDDRGDGIFRLLVPNVFAPDIVPLWVKQRI
jgi:hypothetical protein